MANSTITCNSGAYTIVGAASKLAFALSIAIGSFTLTGTVAVTQYGHPIIANSGAYTLTGQTIQTRRISAAPAGYLVNGQTVNLVYNIPNKKVTAVSGTYTISGTAATRLQKSVPLSIGGYILTGSTVNLTRSAGSAKTIPIVSGSYIITGTAASAIYTELINTGDYQITGGTTTLRHGWSAQIIPGIYLIVAGPPVKLAQSRHFPVTSTSYGLTGSVVTISRGTQTSKVMTGDSTPYFYNGQTVSLLLARRIGATSGTYTINDGHTVFKKQYDPGMYTFTGIPVLFHQNRRLIPTSGTYIISDGGPTIIRGLGKNVQAVNTAYIIAGFQVGLQTRRILTAATGSYIFIGPDITLRVTHLNVATGSYAYSGTDAILTASRIGRWRKHPHQSTTITSQPRITTTWNPQHGAAGV